MNSLDENKRAALELVRGWKAAGATLELSVSGPSEPLIVKMPARVRFADNDDSLAFEWSTGTEDSLPKRSFEHSDGVTVISLEDVSFVISRDPVESLSISRGEYHCLLRVIRASAFGP